MERLFKNVDVRGSAAGGVLGERSIENRVDGARGRTRATIGRALAQVM
ncbi:MAG: hypothetical protein ACREKG_06410 [Candidatus Rokuibacteriota bacterium]